jgi:hypothetical protein
MNGLQEHGSYAFLLERRIGGELVQVLRVTRSLEIVIADEVERLRSNLHQGQLFLSGTCRPRGHMN